MPVNEEAYLAQLLSWSSVDYLIACVFVVAAVGMVLVRYRTHGRWRWLSPLVPLILGGWAFLLGRVASEAYQRLVAGPDTICVHCSPLVGRIWRAQVMQAYIRVYPQSVFLLAACCVCVVVVLFMRRRPFWHSRVVLPGVPYALSAMNGPHHGREKA